MKRIVIALVCFLTGLAFSNSFSQGYTPPKFILGFTLDGNIATNDAAGYSVTSPSSYSMNWGWGVTLHGKYGLGVRKNSRLTLSEGFNHMVNDNANGVIPFFNFSPKAPYTDYWIWTTALGYEYAFNARCKNKQYVGAAVTGNYFVSSKNSFIQFDNSLRIGFQFTTGYEFALGQKQQTGLNVGLKYNLTNIGLQKNGAGSLNDGTGVPGPSFWRRIGILSLNIGLNFYTDVKPYRLK